MGPRSYPSTLTGENCCAVVLWIVRTETEAITLSWTHVRPVLKQKGEKFLEKSRHQMSRSLSEKLPLDRQPFLILYIYIYNIIRIIHMWIVLYKLLWWVLKGRLHLEDWLVKLGECENEKGQWILNLYLRMYAKMSASRFPDRNAGIQTQALRFYWQLIFSSIKKG